MYSAKYYCLTLKIPRQMEDKLTLRCRLWSQTDIMAKDKGHICILCDSQSQVIQWSPHTLKVFPLKVDAPGCRQYYMLPWKRGNENKIYVKCVTKAVAGPWTWWLSGFVLTLHEHGVMRNTQAWLELTTACPPYVEASEVVSILYFFSSPSVTLQIRCFNLLLYSQEGGCVCSNQQAKCHCIFCSCSYTQRPSQHTWRTGTSQCWNFRAAYHRAYFSKGIVNTNQ